MVSFTTELLKKWKPPKQTKKGKSRKKSDGNQLQPTETQSSSTLSKSGKTIRRKKTSEPKIIMSPFTVRGDNQEYAGGHCGWTFGNIPADASQGAKHGEMVVIPIVHDRHLECGDYAIDGELENLFRIERKSKEDLWGTVSGYHSHNSDEARLVKLGKKPETELHWFERNHLMGLNSLDGYGHVIVECSFGDLATNPPPLVKTPSKTITRTILSWMQKYPHIHWHFIDSRRMSEVYAYQLMVKFYNHKRMESNRNADT